MKHIFVNTPIHLQKPIVLEKDIAHRLVRVLRLPKGAILALTNGKDGLFQAEFNGKNTLTPLKQLCPMPEKTTPIGLYICLPKKDTFNRVLRQAVEMGVTDLFPLFSAHTVPTKLNLTRAKIQLIEAVEQCERLDLPILYAPQSLESGIFSAKTPTFWAWERAHEKQPQNGQNLKNTQKTVLNSQKLQKTAFSSPKIPKNLLIGPEGGFSASEITQLSQNPHVYPLSLGQTILRVDTAVVAGLSWLVNSTG